MNSGDFIHLCAKPSVLAIKETPLLCELARRHRKKCLLYSQTLSSNSLRGVATYTSLKCHEVKKSYINSEKILKICELYRGQKITLH